MENWKVNLIEILRKYSKTSHPIKGAWLPENISHYAKISYKDASYEPIFNKGICKTTFKKPSRIHKNYFSTKKHKSDRKSSTEYCKVAKKQLQLYISWSIKGKYKSFVLSSTRFSLCLYQKLETTNDLPEDQLNKQPKVISQFSHRNRYEPKTFVANMKDRGI